MSYIYGTIPPATLRHGSPVLVNQLLGGYQGIILAKVSRFATKHNMKIVASVANVGLKYRKKISLQSVLTPTGEWPVLPTKGTGLSPSSRKFAVRLN